MNNIRDKALVFSSLVLWSLLSTSVKAAEPKDSEEILVETTEIPSLVSTLDLDNPAKNPLATPESLSGTIDQPNNILVSDRSLGEVTSGEVASPPLAEKPVTTSPAVSELMAETKDESVGQVTSVSQLSDVQPDDWAFR